MKFFNFSSHWVYSKNPRRLNLIISGNRLAAIHLDGVSVQTDKWRRPFLHCHKFVVKRCYPEPVIASGVDGTNKAFVLIGTNSERGTPHLRAGQRTKILLMRKCPTFLEAALIMSAPSGIELLFEDSGVKEFFYWSGSEMNHSRHPQ